ncbi:MAG: TIGR00266 family protein [Bacteroidetes bacterium]|nr:TIGR00266 family protein [Bacteroidota bacterium]
MKNTIENGHVYSSLRVEMEQGEQFRAESGAMLSMSPTIELEATSAGKGLFGTIKAAVGGESFFASIFTAVGGPGELILAPSSPGDIVAFDLQNETLYAQAGSYLAGDVSISVGTKGSLKALVAGEGLFLATMSGTGKVFLNSFGAIYSRDLGMGERYIVDTGHVVAFQHTMAYTVKKAASGIFSSLASGEGLVCEFVGPGRVYMQTRNVGAFAKLLVPFMPHSS